VKRVKFSPLAEKEAADAAEWYDARRTGLGDEFLASVRLAVDRLKHLPELGPPFSFTRSGKTIRRLLIDGFPYSPCYFDLGTHLQVLAVAHSSRRPGYWLARVSRAHR
jgi:plasmid stabilization system protein ParE